jgi:Zn-finger nucleic acid-binding protein
MTDFKRHCPTCDVWLQLTEQTRDKAVRCPKCKNVLAPAPAVHDALPVEEEPDEPPARRRRGERDEPPRPRPRWEQDDPPRRRSRRDEEEEPPTVRGRRLTRSNSRFRDEIPADVDERARRLSLKRSDLKPAIRDLIDRELDDDEQVVWIGRHDRLLKFVRGLGWLIGGGVGLVVAVLCFVLGFASSVGGLLLVAGLFIGFVCGIGFFAQVIRQLIPDSRVYVLTTRRALVVGWTLFGGNRATTYGPEVAACPRVRRAWFLSDAGDLVMRTLVVTTTYHSSRGSSITRSRRFFGFIGIRNLDEVDQLCADVLGWYVEELKRPKACWDVMDILQYGTWVGTPVLGLSCCLCGSFGGFFGKLGVDDKDGKKDAALRQVAWQVQADPGPKPPEPFAAAGAPIQVGVRGPAFPHHPAPFVAVEAGPGKNAFAERRTRIQVHDLAAWKPLGPVVMAELIVGDMPALSPDGRWLAMRHRTKRNTLHLCGPFVEAPFDVDCKCESGWEVFRVEFASATRVVAMSRYGQNAPQRGMRFLVYDVAQRREVCTGSTPELYHPRHSAFTPGGGYLATVIKSDEDGNFLVFWDLATGQRAGALDLQTADETCGVSFSPAGDNVSVLFKNAQPGQWGRVATWNLADRSKLHDHALPGNRVKIFLNHEYLGGKATLQWLPDEAGWLVFGYLVVDRKTGAVVGEVQRKEDPVIERVFRGNDQATDVGGHVGRDLKVTDVPRR